MDQRTQIKSTPDLDRAETSIPVMIVAAGIPFNSLIYVNRALCAATGYVPEELIGRSLTCLHGPRTDRAIAAELTSAIRSGRAIRRKILSYRKNGDPFWNDITIDPIMGKNNQRVALISMRPDAAKSGRDDAYAAVEARLSSIVSRVPGYIWSRVMKPDGSFVLQYLSPSINHYLGMPEGLQASGEDFRAHVHTDDYPGLIDSLRRSAADLSVFHEEFRLVSEDGKVRWFRSDAEPRREPNGDVVWDGMSIDITAEKNAAREVAFLSFHDPVTGLSNRELFKRALQAVIDAPSNPDHQIALFAMDLDAFQEINVGLGQSAGDEVLRVIGQRLVALAAEEHGTAARLGGDEFGLLLPAIPQDRSLADTAEALAREVSRPIEFQSRQIVMQACIGGALIAPRGETAEARSASAVMSQADLALHAAKRAGHGSCRLYTADLDEGSQNQMELRQSLPAALEEGQFRLHYQPLVHLDTGRIIGAEALVRWQHPTLGLVPPDRFIPLAEVSGHIAPLGAWVIQEAMRQHQEWKSRGLRPPRIAINISSVQLRRPGFVDMVRQCLDRTDACGADFEFEMTEGLLLEASVEVLAILSALKSMGFRITVDDFGTGHATFKYLRDFPIDKLKIDKVFVRQLVIDSSDAFIIRAIVALSHSLRIEVLAEGIETEMQLDFLRAEGCETGQGYLFSMPLVPEDMGWMLEQRVRLPMPRKPATE
jgi:diguanylate cyclase (GGDEF)-like protein/PAS domain S-box-containing protein